LLVKTGGNETPFEGGVSDEDELPVLIVIC
jgi:hypothetical protein